MSQDRAQVALAAHRRDDHRGATGTGRGKPRDDLFVDADQRELYVRAQSADQSAKRTLGAPYLGRIRVDGEAKGLGTGSAHARFASSSR